MNTYLHNFRYFLDPSTEKKIETDGLKAFFNLLHPEDRETLTHRVTPAMFQKVGQLSSEEKLKVRAQYNYRIRKEDGNYRQILQQSIILELNDSNQPILDLSMLTEIGKVIPPGQIKLSMFLLNQDKKYELIKEETFSNNAKLDLLTKRELQILKLVASGLTSKKISQQLHISQHTVNTHRRNMLAKLKMKSITELVHFAKGNGRI